MRQVFNPLTGETTMVAEMVDLNYVGDYDAKQEYNEGDIVIKDGSSYIFMYVDGALSMQILAAKGKDGKDGEDGKKGDPGEPGKKGEPGTPGEPGKDGEPGKPGRPGTPGDKGADGSKWYSGKAKPSKELGADQDLYLRTINGDVYQRLLGSWTLLLNIKGDKGKDGDPGRSGAPGKGTPGTGGPSASGYSIANGPDTQVDYVYVGLLNTSGAWYIYRRNRTTDAREYAQGSSDYATNWTDRESLTYN